MKISIKLGMWFFFCILVIEIFSMFFLHNNLVHSQVHQELGSLQARGNSHRSVLEINSDSATLHHIGLMESHTDTEVVITNTTGDVLLSSSKLNQSMRTILNKPIDNLPRNGRVLQSDWQKEQYIATVTAFNKGGEKAGYVYMFKNTDEVQKLISQLNKHFLLASVLILLFMIITIFFLSKALTKPLISMKEATKKLSKGDFSVTLPPPSRDELGELAQSIQTLANDLNYLKQERNEFLASISHELRTPLTYIKGYADIAKRKELAESDRDKYLDIIQEEADHVSRLLKELFDLAKLDQNTFSISKQKVNLSDFLQSILEKVLPAFNEKKILFKLECSRNLTFDLDPIRFEQVLLNLLDNNLKYSKENTCVHIKVFEGNEAIHMVITDQGIGIPEKDLPHIFDRLYRVDKSRSRATGGFGLGLAIVKELVEAHGGEISAESEAGKGTCFKIFLNK
ncbi:HAMP domain-containing histidine kinase [Bacillus salipaludis]|uniref:histidine kinase n=1 Tax=Bacillus salipaludis TaxID=2547811 RepID=A0A4R5VVF0_9BACI|nr:ATP-binding protein [Bacillus salipaludis]MDQ6600330.1 ATP-binding protein [Bacillus salipaludis]TDK62225.1 HAMP domain-containing histidine kinase [Bacillus salipaludis]